MPLDPVRLRAITRALRRLALQCSCLVVEEDGQDLIEYALVAFLLALSCVALMRSLGTQIASAYLSISSTLSSNL